MVDLNAAPPTGTAGESSKIKNLMGRTPGIGMLKSKFLTVLGNSNELLNGISNKLTLTISSSESEYCDDDEEVPKFDESIDYTKIDFESRRLKARRAHEEIISGRYRHPNLAPKARLEATRAKTVSSTRRRSLSADAFSTSASSSSSTTTTSKSHSPRQNVAASAEQQSSTTRSDSIESRHSGGYGRPPGRAVAGARRSDMDVQRDRRHTKAVVDVVGAPHIDVQPPVEQQQLQLTPNKTPIAVGRPTVFELSNGGGSAAAATSMRAPAPSGHISASSTLTSLRDDELQISPSIESFTDWRNFIRSESQNSMPSWASSISLDCRAGDESIKQFMQHFTALMFGDVSAIEMGAKEEFAALMRLEAGRQWFTRCLLAQNVKSKCIKAMSFVESIPFFTIFLFECVESRDFGSAAIVMNLCFSFYREIEVPGCDPYRDYLFLIMRQQQIWSNLDFWNAAFLEAIQNEEKHRLAAKRKHREKHEKQRALKNVNIALEAEQTDGKCQAGKGRETASDDEVANEPEAEIKATLSSSSSSSSHHGNAVPGDTLKPERLDKKLMEIIIFRQLGTFTSNMHALGTCEENCVEFLLKQSEDASLPKDKVKIIRDNIHRMFHETELWGFRPT